MKTLCPIHGTDYVSTCTRCDEAEEQNEMDLGYGDDKYRSLNLTVEDDIFAYGGGEL